MHEIPDSQRAQVQVAAVRREARRFAVTLAAFTLAAALLGRLGVLDLLGDVSPRERGPVTAPWLASRLLGAAVGGVAAYALWVGMARLLRRRMGAP